MTNPLPLLKSFNMRTLLITTLIMFSAFLLSCSKVEFDEGKESFLQQDYRKAFIRLMPSAKSGNAEAQYAIGYMYYTGQGTVQNREKAKEWISKSARQNYPTAISALKQINNPPYSPYKPSNNPALNPL